MRDIRAVIFDMDGVLVDSEPINFEAMRRVLSGHGIPYTQVDDRGFLGRRNADVFGALRATHSLPIDDDALERELTTVLIHLIRERCTPMPGVPVVLTGLGERGYRLALASSSAPAVIAEHLAALGIVELFDAVVSGVEVTHGKPAPDIFLETARRLAVAPHECLVVEDSRNGVLAARAAGMACAAIPCSATLHEDFSDATLSLTSLRDLEPLLPGVRGAPGRRVDQARAERRDTC